MFRQMLNQEVGGKTIKEHNKRWQTKCMLEARGFIFEVSLQLINNKKPYRVSIRHANGTVELLGEYATPNRAILRALKE